MRTETHVDVPGATLVPPGPRRVEARDAVVVGELNAAHELGVVGF